MPAYMHGAGVHERFEFRAILEQSAPYPKGVLDRYGPV